MVSQILWLGVKDVFTQIAKDVVGHASDRGQDLGLITALGGAMTTSAYVSCIVFNLIPSRFKVCDRRLRRLVMLKIDFFFRMPRFMLEMFAGLKMFRDIARQIADSPLSDGAMVSQILWLGVKDVFTQIAKDVVGHASDRGVIDRGPKSACRD
ncbi:hypothetical protein F2Q68_00043962 [Brassica cretica]|uniref:Uncharacterized protein n=1 Tax=Brassica cretica TaxID=69181 RepID=A0A8S9LUF1_BRACR|nr:hypothetical protein F2Q68_00043962 [Brassica cretica]